MRKPKRRTNGGLKIGRRPYWILVAIVMAILVGAVLVSGGRTIMFTWNVQTGFRLLTLLLAAFAPFTLLYAGRLRDIGRSNWWALVVPVVTLGLLFGGLNLAFSLQEAIETWEFSWTLMMLWGTLLLAVVAWLAPTIWLGTRPSKGSLQA